MIDGKLACDRRDDDWGVCPGAQAMQRIAAPSVSGLASATLLALVVIPAVFASGRDRSLPR